MCVTVLKDTHTHTHVHTQVNVQHVDPHQKIMLQRLNMNEHSSIHNTFYILHTTHYFSEVNVVTAQKRFTNNLTL